MFVCFSFSSEVFLKDCPERFYKIYRKVLAVNFSAKLQTYVCNSTTKASITGAFLWTLWDLSELLFPTLPLHFAQRSLKITHFLLCDRFSQKKKKNWTVTYLTVTVTKLNLLKREYLQLLPGFTRQISQSGLVLKYSN